MLKHHDFTLVIPVADRPRQLAACLDSLRKLLRRYPHDGRISLLIAEDSADPKTIALHRRLAEQLTNDGIPAHHLDATEQRALISTLMAALPPDTQMRLESVLGSATAADFHHKGASLTRNIAYLWLARHRRHDLIWFFDSDQAFQVPLADGTLHEIDYFHELNRIFSDTATQILTGKVVGDPPVSPAVMAGTLLDDLSAFVAELSQCQADAPCSFHQRQTASDAAYHDMPELFGFAKPAPLRYGCELSGDHDHRACLAAAAARLPAFFDGVHPTRRNAYTPSDALATLSPARTLYTGNFIMRPAGLIWFIPFAALRLRMAGPTLGRIIQAEIGDAFVSANLPMLHRRSETECGGSEFRPGINKSPEYIDISDEFERQYFGDVMLFTITRITRGEANSAPLIAEVEAEMQARYRQKQQEVSTQIAQLATQLDALAHAWHEPLAAPLSVFLTNLRHNFGRDASVWSRIGNPDIRAARRAKIHTAIDRYAQERGDWQTALKGMQA